MLFEVCLTSPLTGHVWATAIERERVMYLTQYEVRQSVCVTTGRQTARARAHVAQPRRTMMRFHNQARAFYCGVDLHARTMYLCDLETDRGSSLQRCLAQPWAAALP
jgi:hypothetical protein